MFYVGGMEISTREPGVFAHRAVPPKEETHNLLSIQKAGSRLGEQPSDLCTICVTESTPDHLLDPHQELVFLPQSVEPIFMSAVICTLQRVLM